MKRNKRRITISVITLLLVVAGGLAYWKIAHGATITWNGAGVDGTCGGAGTANNWSCGANWGGGVAPGGSDIATFDTTSTKNATINGNISVAGIAINSGYSGTITQGGSFTVTVGASNFSQAAGTFTGGTNSITLNGTYTLSGGTFTSTSGTLTVGGNVTANVTIFTLSGGTFNHNNGTVSFIAGYTNTRTFTVDVLTSLTFYNIVWNSAGTPEGEILATAAGDTIIAANDFTITNGALSGTWEVQGNVIIGAAADGNFANGTLTMTGSGAKTYSCASGGYAPFLRVNNAGISVSAAGGTTDLGLSSFSLLAGAFTAPTGTMTIDSSAVGSITVFNVASGVTFNHNNGTIRFYSSGGSNHTYTADVNVTLTLYNVIENLDNGGGGPSVLTTAAGDTIVVANNFTQTSGGLYGTWQAQGNVSIGSAATGGTATLSFTGGNAQTYTEAGGANAPDGNITINKTAGTSVTLGSAATWNAASQTTTVTAGTLAQSTFNIAATNFTVNGGTYTGGSGTLTTSGPFSMSSGTFTGGTNSITVNGTYTLSGGTFTSTTGTMTFGGASFTHTAGGTFNHNNGTVSLGNGGQTAFTIDVATSETFYNLTVLLNDYGRVLTISSGDTLIVANTFSHSTGTINTGTVEARGNVVIGSNLVSGAGGGNATLSFLVAGDQTITSGGGTTMALNINKPSGTVSVTGNLGTTGFTLASGVFTSTSSTLTVSGNFNTVWTHTVGGTFNHNNGTVTFVGINPVIIVTTSETFYNLTVNVNDSGRYLNITSGDTLIVLNTLNQSTGGICTGAVEARGNVSIGANAGGCGATLSFTGGNAQTYTEAGGANAPDGNITINKTAGTSVTLGSTANWNAASQTTTITSGLLIAPVTYSIATGALTVGASGVLRMAGTGALTLGGNVANAGEIDARSTTCGQTDYVQIRSSVNGTQRLWSGAGTFKMYDVDVKDQAGSSAITLYSSTNTGNNGANWTFSGAACPTTLAPAMSLGAGSFQIGSGVVNLIQ